VQGAAVVVKIEVSRWRCLNRECERRTFTDQLAEIVEIVSRDRCGLYAQAAREGASQARQVADRFHLLQNLRETIEA
jgi:transposase